jgi:hypothetical protein
MKVVVGLDLSLTGAGMVAVPSFWGGDWNRVAHHTFGEKLPRDAEEALRIGRLTRISAAVVEFARRHGATDIAIEGYAFASMQSHAHSLGELGGVVRHQVVHQLGIVPSSVPVHSGRKLLLGKVPRKDAKIATRAFLTKAGMPASWSMDEGDAFVVANFALSELGAFAFVTAPEGKAA